MTEPLERLKAALADRYRIERELGAGGMATVYLAEDLKHHRKVAVKVLHPELAAVLGAERFLAEIQTTANLQHPHILPLHDSGQAGGLLFYVMPYVEGETLRARLTREQQLPIEDAIRITREVASALDYAHRHGVIHRDIKPENILLHEGQALIADFGIALAVSTAGGQRMTQTGISLGTPEYMSPEQALGERTVTAKSDVYALGCVLYEMLTGEPPFTGATIQAIVARVLHEEPRPVHQVRKTVPTHVEAATLHALAKLPADRFGTASEFAAALQGKGEVEGTLGHVQLGGASVGLRMRRRLALRELVAWVLVAVAAVVLARQFLRPRGIVEAPVVRVNLELPTGERVREDLVGTTIAVSPQGDRVAYTSFGRTGFHTYVRRTSEFAGREVGEIVVARNLTFSPDGRWIAYTEGNHIKKVQVDGGTSVAIGTTSVAPLGLVWSGSDTVFIGSQNGLMAVSANGGTATPVFRADAAAGPVSQRWPVILQDGHTVIFASSPSDGTGVSQLAVASLGGGPVTLLGVSALAPLGVLQGYLVYVTSAGDLMAVPFDRRARKPTGEPTVVARGVVVDVNNGAKASLSASGTLAYLQGRAESYPVLSALNREDIPLIQDARRYSTPRFSPDGRRLAVTVFGDNAADVWVYDLTRNTFTRLTSEGSSIRPEWSPGGERVLFRSDRGGKIGIWWQPADGSAGAELLFEPEVEPYEAILSPNGEWLIYRTAPGARYSRDIFAVRLAGDRSPVPLVTGPASEQMPRLSPDGRWLAYQSNESGRQEIYVRPFPGSGARVQVTTEGGIEPLWAASGRTLYYRTPFSTVVAVEVTTGTSFSLGDRHSVLTGEYLTDPSHQSYDVSPDGSHLLMLKRAGEESKALIVHNWGRELREKLTPGPRP